MPAIGVDFDGVIHQYSVGWHEGVIYDPPVDGTCEALRDLMDVYSVFVFTARTDLDAVAAWIEATCSIRCVVDDGMVGFWDRRDALLVTFRKVAAVAYIDDRGIRFESWPQALAQLAAHEAPWRDRPG